MGEKIVRTNYTIKELPKTERPTEKLLNNGAEILSNEELLAVIIRTGSREATAIELGKRVLSLDERGLRFLIDSTVEELKKVRGIGNTKAAQILAAVELGKRISYSEGLDRIRISSPSSIAGLYMGEMRFLSKEHFRVILLDTKNQIISTEEISIGTLNAAIVHPRDVFKLAIKKNANSIILIHNHPSGDTSPSKEDINVTLRLKEVGDIIGIRVVDYLIIGDNKYLSFKEENII